MNTAMIVLGIFMLVVGFALVVFEMYIPGFGLPGISGIILLIGGIVVMRPTPLRAACIALAVLILLAVALAICMRSASKGRFANSRFVLKDVSNTMQEKPDLTSLVGKEGVAHTVLRPAGMADFDGVKLNVVSNGEFIEPGEKVRVTRVDGNKILVDKA